MPSLFAVLPMATANAHGYISSPPSRQAECAQGIVGCGPIKYEPQSVEGPKGLRSCDGGLSRFSDLNDDSKPWRATPVGNTVSFTWTNTAVHRTANWEYYIGNTRIATFDGNNVPPGSTVTHTVDLSGFSGRQKLLAVWNIGDTPNAFYSCVDLQIGGTASSAAQAPAAQAPAPAAAAPSPTAAAPSPATQAPPAAAATPSAATPGTWSAGATYAVGDTVSYDGKRYRCQQAHSVVDPTWTPPSTPALWQAIG